MSYIAQHKKISFQAKVEDEVGEVHGSGDRVAQVLLNLLNNAVKVDPANIATLSSK